MTVKSWDQVRLECALVERQRLDSLAFGQLMANFPQLDPASVEHGVARDGETWEPLTPEQYRAQVARNRGDVS